MNDDLGGGSANSELDGRFSVHEGVGDQFADRQDDVLGDRGGQLPGGECRRDQDAGGLDGLSLVGDRDHSGADGLGLFARDCEEYSDIVVRPGRQQGFDQAVWQGVDRGVGVGEKRAESVDSFVDIGIPALNEAVGIEGQQCPSGHGNLLGDAGERSDSERRPGGPE